MMIILTILCATSILTSLLLLFLVLVGVPINKTFKIIALTTMVPTFLGAMLLPLSMGEVEQLRKEKLDKYEPVTFTVYKKK